MARTRAAQVPAPQTATTVTVATARLERALKQLAPAISNRATLPALQGVKITPHGDHFTVAGTDLELTAEVQIPGAAHGDPFVVHFGVLREAVHSAGDDMAAISLEVDGTSLRIGGNGTLTMRTLPLEDWPTMPEPEGVKVVAECSVLIDRFLRTATCSSDDTSRPVLTSVLFELGDGALTLTATDSYRLASMGVPVLGPTGESLKRCIPARVVAALKPFAKAQGPLRMVFGESAVSFTLPTGLTFTTRIIEGEFPNWRSLIPQKEPAGRLTVTRRLLDAIKASWPLTPSSTALKVAFAKGESVLTAGSQDSHDWRRPVVTSWDGEPLDAGFNPFYWHSVLALAGPDAVFQVLDGLKPAWVTWTEEDGSKGVSLVMPVRLS